MSTPVIQLCCPPVLTGPLSQDDAEQLAAALRVIADPARLRLLGLIKNQPDAEACTCDLVEPLGLSQPTVSHHLKVLYEAGFLEREKRGRQTWYRLAPDSLGILRDALDPNVHQRA
ncbi:ArsR/SmtB family transcription factor [Streptomyces ochraceiscleroticus]|uniref:Metalloregulator ArsR/SmtB family transcription factor n=1 Tax=Streptomyces ochraceiscleroticus TaxID=47761 RepID=A0ABW1MLD7_9ACTN|nr:metalloregulator ArsR/SmtB family transcription factor [Streptomyces ochraceiscleroticus]